MTPRLTIGSPSAMRCEPASGPQDSYWGDPRSDDEREADDAGRQAGDSDAQRLNRELCRPSGDAQAERGERFMKTKNYSVIHRNYGHWDIIVDSSRAFRIRGTPGDFVVHDEREKPYPSTRFKTVGMCMGFIAEQLMFEHLDEDKSSPGNNKPIQP